MSRVVAAPGRVNLIGDHTDYTGGLVLPMAIDRWTVLEVHDSDGMIELCSVDETEPVRLELPVGDPAAVSPAWGRYVAGVAAEMTMTSGISGVVSTTIPIGSGLSSSAALEIATALALGFEGPAVDLAQLCRRAEQRASGVPCGIMDQLCIAAAVDGHAMLIDCGDLTVTAIPVPDDVAVLVQFVAPRRLAGSEYADRVAECTAVGEVIGPLRTATIDVVESIGDPVLAARARHVVSENERVGRAVTALLEGDMAALGRSMIESHRSLAADYATSTPAMDRAVERFTALRGVLGARMTGGGFGGCVVAIVDRRHVSEVVSATGAWVVQPVGGAAHRRSGRDQS